MHPVCSSFGVSNTVIVNTTLASHRKKVQKGDRIASFDEEIAIE